MNNYSGRAFAMQRRSVQRACGRDKQSTSRRKATPNRMRSRAAQAKVRTRKKGASEELRVGRSSVANEQTISHRTHSTIADCRPQPTSQVDKPLDAAKTTKRANSAGACARKKKQSFFTRPALKPAATARASGAKSVGGEQSIYF